MCRIPSFPFEEIPDYLSPLIFYPEYICKGNYWGISKGIDKLIICGIGLSNQDITLNVMIALKSLNDDEFRAESLSYLFRKQNGSEKTVEKRRSLCLRGIAKISGVLKCSIESDRKLAFEMIKGLIHPPFYIQEHSLQEIQAVEHIIDALNEESVSKQEKILMVELLEKLFEQQCFQPIIRSFYHKDLKILLNNEKNKELIKALSNLKETIIFIENKDLQKSLRILSKLRMDTRCKVLPENKKVLKTCCVIS